MLHEKIPDDFWYDNVSKSNGKHNIAPDAWERICKIRNSPIILIEDFIIGEDHKPHMVIPKGYKGFLYILKKAWHRFAPPYLLRVFVSRKKTLDN